MNNIFDLLTVLLGLFTFVGLPALALIFFLKILEKHKNEVDNHNNEIAEFEKKELFEMQKEAYKQAIKELEDEKKN